MHLCLFKGAVDNIDDTPVLQGHVSICGGGTDVRVHGKLHNTQYEYEPQLSYTQDYLSQVVI